MAHIGQEEVKEARVIAIVRSSEANEVRLTATTMDTGRRLERFIDFRKFWIKTRGVEELPTKKGVNISRESIPGVILALLKEMRAEEFTDDQATELRKQMERIMTGDAR